VGVVKSGKRNNVNAHNWNGLEFVFTQRYVHVIIFSNFSVQIAHHL